MTPDAYRPVPAEQVLAARQMMRRGYSMTQAALSLWIIPSSRLDLALWKHIDTDDEDLVLQLPKRWGPDF
jgi:hypothetical protein